MLSLAAEIDRSEAAIRGLRYAKDYGDYSLPGPAFASTNPSRPVRSRSWLWNQRQIGGMEGADPITGWTLVSESRHGSKRGIRKRGNSHDRIFGTRKYQSRASRSIGGRVR